MTGAVVGSNLFVGVVAQHASTADFPPVDELLARYENRAQSNVGGYVLARADGGISAFGEAPACRSVAGASVAMVSV